jgi:hypothetical protein
MGTSVRLLIICLLFVGVTGSLSVAAQSFMRVDAFAPPFGPTQGSAWADYDGDGDQDVFVASGNVFAPDSQSVLYRNRGDGTFERIVDGPIATDRLAAFSGAWGDFDGDRDLDLLVAGAQGTDFNVEAISSPRLYLNDGFGGFSRFIPSAFPTDLRALTAVAVWLDMENDGDLDIYLGNDWGPSLSDVGVPNLLFRNEGHRILMRITDDPALGTQQQTLSAAASDFDNDGDADLFVGNGGPGAPGYANDNLFLNDGHGNFVAVVDSDVVRSEGWTVTPAWIDYDNDGDNDLFAANVFTPHFLFRNDGGVLSRVSSGVLVNDTGNARLGAAWGDFDNDGDLDVLTNDSFGTPHVFYINDGNGDFTRRESVVATQFAGMSSSADYDFDGDLDLFIGDGAFGDGQDFLLRNDGTKNRWVSIQPQGRKSNWTGIGAKIRVRAKIDGRVVSQLREISQQSSWGGHGPLLAHVGLRDTKWIDEVRIEWPSGEIDVERGVRSNSHYVAIEGRGLITLQEALIARLIERVDRLAASKTLNRGQHVSLRVALVAALKLTNNPHGHSAERLIAGFKKQVDTLARKHVLDEREAAWLLDPATNVQRLLRAKT